MTVTKRYSYQGRKAKVGSVCFTDTGRLAFFLDYCPSCNGKILVNIDEAREFARKFGKQERNFKKRVAVRLLEKISA